MAKGHAPMSWRPRSAWEGILENSQAAAQDVFICAGPDRSIDHLAIDPGNAELFKDEFQNSVGLSVNIEPQRVANGNFELIWAGPGQWLFCCGSGVKHPGFNDRLQDITAITDLSDSRAILRISGPRARDILARGCPIDLHPRKFRTNDVALTTIAHIGVHIWQIDEAPTYEIAIFRSYAMSFWSWLKESM